MDQTNQKRNRRFPSIPFQTNDHEHRATSPFILTSVSKKQRGQRKMADYRGSWRIEKGKRQLGNIVERETQRRRKSNSPLPMVSLNSFASRHSSTHLERTMLFPWKSHRKRSSWEIEDAFLGTKCIAETNEIYYRQEAG